MPWNRFANKIGVIMHSDRAFFGTNARRQIQTFFQRFAQSIGWCDRRHLRELMRYSLHRELKCIHRLFDGCELIVGYEADPQDDQSFKRR
jgi:hypothetical protein